tara:strand:+ start:397 stop:540 length:144 start_codon:yes stop_codon:yes gene_type:complete
MFCPQGGDSGHRQLLQESAPNFLDIEIRYEVAEPQQRFRLRSLGHFQ